MGTASNSVRPSRALTKELRRVSAISTDPSQGDAWLFVASDLTRKFLRREVFEKLSQKGLELATGIRNDLVLGLTLFSVNFFLVVIVPIFVGAFSAFAPRPSRAAYGNAEEAIGDFQRDRYRWLAEVGMSSQLTGLTTVIGTLLDRGLYTTPTGFVVMVCYTFAMLFGIVEYREHRRATVVQPWWGNLPLVIGLATFAGAEIFGAIMYY